MDKYDEQIAHLKTLTKDEIYDEWRDARGIFAFVAQNSQCQEVQEGTVGCLTMIRRGNYVAATPELTEAIRADERIPAIDVRELTHDDFEVFAEWQRRIDVELSRD